MMIACEEDNIRFFSQREDNLMKEWTFLGSTTKIRKPWDFFSDFPKEQKFYGKITLRLS